VWTAVALIAISLVAPLLSGADAATTIALLGLHLVPAAVMISALGAESPRPGRLTVPHRDNARREACAGGTHLAAALAHTCHRHR
jgi:hypothetical protein